MRLTFFLIFFCQVIFGQQSIDQKIDSAKNKTLVLPSYRYINLNNHLAGLIVTNVKLRESNDPLSKFKFWVEPLFHFGESFAGLVAVSNKWKTKGIFKSIEPSISYKQFPYFKNEKLGYVLNYNKYRFDAKFYLEDQNCDCFYLTLSRIGISERFAKFTNTNAFTFSNLSTAINRIEMHKEWNDNDDYGYAFNMKIDNAYYKDPFDLPNTFTRLDLRYTAFWKIKNYKQFKVSFYLGYFLQNDHRNAFSFSNEIVKGSIALSQQGFNDYAYDENFASRQSNAGLWDNQISNFSGGGFKYASSFNNNLGLSNDLAFAINSSVNLPGTGNLIKTAAYFDLGGYKVGKINYLYSGGFSIDYNDVIQLYLPLISSNSISQSYRTGISFFEKINYKIKLVHHFTNRT